MTISELMTLAHCDVPIEVGIVGIVGIQGNPQKRKIQITCFNVENEFYEDCT